MTATVFVPEGANVTTSHAEVRPSGTLKLTSGLDITGQLNTTTLFEGGPDGYIILDNADVSICTFQTPALVIGISLNQV
ncbi:MAG: hypothetical protein ACRCUF_19345, partial [Aeromonas sobria]